MCFLFKNYYTEAQNKKVRLNLKLHVKTRDTQKLPPAIKSFKKSKLPDSEGDLVKGEKIMKEEQARESKRQDT